jgi:hypothetical protein
MLREKSRIGQRRVVWQSQRLADISAKISSTAQLDISAFNRRQSARRKLSSNEITP